MTSCTAWRAQAESHSPVCLPPGGCHRCWRPCHARLSAGDIICPDCVEAAADHRSPAVRTLLATSGLVGSEWLERLAHDGDAACAMAARDELDRRSLATPRLDPESAEPVMPAAWTEQDW